MRQFIRWFLGCNMFVFSLCAEAQTVCEVDKISRDVLVEMLTGKYWQSSERVGVRSVFAEGNGVRIEFTNAATTVPITAAKLTAMTDSVRRWTESKNAKVSFWANNLNLQELIPPKNIVGRASAKPMVQRVDDGERANMYGRNVALWNSHGRYYDNALDTWKWQRARLFTTVEDLLTSSFVLQFLVPMLENGGASVFLPRERDMQTNMVVVDNDICDSAIVICGAKLKNSKKGYRFREIITDSENPFLSGTAATYKMSHGDSIVFRTAILEEGEYAVYVSYVAHKQHTNKAYYTVAHRDGTTKYQVNQRVGGGMWVYLGTHRFAAESGCEVTISGSGMVSVDAIRLGGGTGMVVRGNTTSHKPRWMEAARYHLQADGFAAETVYSLSKFTNDFNDDINCRGEWVNALINNKKIPVDIAVALHTDAGIARCDSTIGTLAIVSTTTSNCVFADKRSRRLSRHLAHKIVEQIAADTRQTWDSCWTERGIWDRGYAEARRSNVPTVLLELLSHQNLNDMRYALHPQFRFDMSRSIYKGILRFLEGSDACVQPLPVRAFGLHRTAADSIRLSWQPTVDPLEPTAMPTAYRIFANNSLVATVSDTTVVLQQPTDGRTTEYHIVATNKGGAAFPSTTLAARLNGDAPLALFVDGFDRVSPPDVIEIDNIAGFALSGNGSVAWGNEQYSTGAQYDYNPHSQWTENDNPGWGASYADDEGKIFSGSRQKSAAKATRELVEADYSFVSVDKRHYETVADTTAYSLVRISLDRQRTTWYGNAPQQHGIYTAAFIDRTTQLCQTDAKIVISGNYIGSDIDSEAAKQFAKEVLGFRHRSGNASRTGIVVGAGVRKATCDNATDRNFDSLSPCGGARTTLRYEDSGATAEVEFGNVTVRGFSSIEK